MLTLFTVCVTPKSYFLNCLADHSSFAVTNPGDETTVSKYSFHCSCDELVALEPFIETSSQPVFAFFIPYNEFSASPYHFVFHPNHSAKDLRGPPTAF